MNVEDFKPEELLSCGIDERTVRAIQLRFPLNKDGKGVQEKLTKAADNEEDSRIKDQCSTSSTNSTQNLLVSSSLDVNQINKSIQLSVCCCAFFHGFSEIDQQSIEALEKVINGKLSKMCEQLKAFGNRLKQEKPAEFKNPVHQVLEMHLLPVQALFDFYRSRVLAPFELLLKKQNNNNKTNLTKNNITTNEKKQQRRRKRKREI